ncbi:uncharacterized protein (DUF1800 family) [Inhella inkyongensis]|uniref:Uncharacterized protein (DUF1800 family) n=1 Tax=Inhella inkyongensis TaxID=392593 RepID=A0A840S4A1_9BURK|nr:DUF1800 domain-containing protein [Inhella inkyongensis]MBB5205195.1 uncharacterized protein (DUF1800 family) [Inhella inkyongensis]
MQRRSLLAALPLLSALPLRAMRLDERPALHALNRLAFGPRPGDLLRVRGWEPMLEEQLALPAIPVELQVRLDAHVAQQPSLRERLQAYRAAQQRDPGENNAERREIVQRALLDATQARLLRALESPRQLEERLVDFWFNHFNVFIGKGLCRVMVADYEAQAIRPHVWGRFRDLLGAVARHPAMLFYLDNFLSARPGFSGRNGVQGLNENYARELMELHTLGVDGGYAQRDVTELARVLTGWTFDLRRGDARFRFDVRRHDEGPKTWLGQTVPGHGEAQGEWVLDQLARHPKTAERIAFKLAQHFVADAPDADLVQATAQAFLKSDGDLRATVTALLRHPVACASELVGAQFKTPQRFVISMLRACSITPSDWSPTLAALRQLGQPLFGCVTPDGWKPTREAWLDPEALARRAELAARVAQRAGLGAEAGERLLDTLGPAISPATRAALRQEPARLQAALILGSPDFQNG